MGEAVKEGVVNNETLGYFMARTYLFLLRVGMILAAALRQGDG